MIYELSGHLLEVAFFSELLYFRREVMSDMLAGWIAPGFEVEGFVSALLGSLLLSLLSLGVSRI